MLILIGTYLLHSWRSIFGESIMLMKRKIINILSEPPIKDSEIMCPNNWLPMVPEEFILAPVVLLEESLWICKVRWRMRSKQMQLRMEEDNLRSNLVIFLLFHRFIIPQTIILAQALTCVLMNQNLKEKEAATMCLQVIKKKGTDIIHEMVQKVLSWLIMSRVLIIEDSVAKDYLHLL